MACSICGHFHFLKYKKKKKKKVKKNLSHFSISLSSLNEKKSFGNVTESC